MPVTINTNDDDKDNIQHDLTNFHIQKSTKKESIRKITIKQLKLIGLKKLPMYFIYMNIFLSSFIRLVQML